MREVLFAVVEGGDREVAGGAIEGEDEVLDIICVELGAEGFDEPAVGLLADFLEILEGCCWGFSRSWRNSVTVAERSLRETGISWLAINTLRKGLLRASEKSR